MVPTGGEGECLKILRLEDGSLADLANIFLDLTRPFLIPAGSVLLLHSTSHLSWVGPAAYAEDFERARIKICSSFNFSICVLHGLPILSCGSLDKNVVLDLITVSNWYNCVKHHSERDISSARSTWLHHSVCGQPTPPSSRPTALLSYSTVSGQSTALLSLSRLVWGQPTALHSGTSHCSQPTAPPLSAVHEMPLATGGAKPKAAPPPPQSLSSMPTALQACWPTAQETICLKLRLLISLDSLQSAIFSMETDTSFSWNSADESTERALLSTLVSELNTKFSAGLDSNFSTSRDVRADTEEDDQSLDSFIVVGGSHASRLVRALIRLGESVTCLAKPTWRLTDENVSESAKALADAVKGNSEAVVLFQLFDSCIYFSSSSPGEQALPKRGEDGVYHVPGDLVLADSFRKIFVTALPLRVPI